MAIGCLWKLSVCRNQVSYANNLADAVDWFLIPQSILESLNLVTPPKKATKIRAILFKYGTPPGKGAVKIIK